MRLSYGFIIIFILALLLTGCSTAKVNYENNLSDFSQAKRIANKNLHDDERKSILPWERENVKRVSYQNLPDYILTDELSSEARIYKVQFYTSKDEIVGPIGIYVDVVSEIVIGRQLRN